MKRLRSADIVEGAKHRKATSYDILSTSPPLTYSLTHLLQVYTTMLGVPGEAKIAIAASERCKCLDGWGGAGGRCMHAETSERAVQPYSVFFLPCVASIEAL